MIPDNLIGIHGEEERIRNQPINYIEQQDNLSEYLNMIYKSLDTIYSFIIARNTSDADEIAVLYLGIRLFNDSSSMMKLFLSGYYLNSFMIMRDLIETGYLLD